MAEAEWPDETVVRAVWDPTTGKETDVLVNLYEVCVGMSFEEVARVLERRTDHLLALVTALGEKAE